MKPQTTIYEKGVQFITDTFVNKHSFRREITDIQGASRELEALRERKKGNKIEYCGGCVGRNIYRDKHAAIQMAKMKKGDIFPRHRHTKRTEVLIVTVGAIKVWAEEIGTLLLQAGSEKDSVYFNKEQEHRIEALEDACIIGIIMPANGEGYPDAR